VRYRKKPVVVEARQYDGTNGPELLAWALGELRGGVLTINTLEGDMVASPGDYIICGVEGEFYPCKPAIFEATYEPVDE
jgi:hypothetical protein